MSRIFLKTNYKTRIGFRISAVPINYLCVFLANKMDLFSKLLRNISNEVLVRNCRYIYVPIEESIELLKVILDIHNFKYSVVYSNRNIYNEQHYIRMIRKYYKVTSIFGMI